MQNTPPISLSEIRTHLQALPAADSVAEAAAREQQATLLKPRGALGRLEALAIWMASWQGRNPPQVNTPQIAVFAANHGIAAQGVSAWPQEVTAQMVSAMVAGHAAINQLARVANAGLRVYEMDLAHPTADITLGPAMTEPECARAIAYGMAAVEPGTDLLCLGEMGIANTAVAAALSAALFGGEASDWVGPGAGLSPEGMDNKRLMVSRALAVNHASVGAGDPLAVLCALGGFELAAIAGAVLAARLVRVPVVLDGFTATAAAAVIASATPGGLDHCLVSHCSAEPGHRRLLDRLGLEPLIDFGLRLGEASGAALVIPLIRAAVACHEGMGTLAVAGVSPDTSKPDKSA